jgi:hypothetical protein
MRLLQEEVRETGHAGVAPLEVPAVQIVVAVRDLYCQRASRYCDPQIGVLRATRLRKISIAHRL